MQLTIEQLMMLERRLGDSFYILDTVQFQKNYDELLHECRKKYDNVYISYSYKTNYIPDLCKSVEVKKGYAEVVSAMEYDLAKEIGVPISRIIYNGPYKDLSKALEVLMNEGIVNIDSYEEFMHLYEMADRYKNKIFKIGIRCNFDLNDGMISRFGVDVNSQEWIKILTTIKKSTNLILSGLHCHFSSRDLETWKNKVNGILNCVQNVAYKKLDYISVGGGMYGKMKDSLKNQFETYIPSYSEYAKCIFEPISKKFQALRIHPKVFIEPGSALAGDVMQYVCKVISVKNIRGQVIASTSGSVYNINPTLNGKNPPISIFSKDKGSHYFEGINFAGYTCIESDFLYRKYNGSIMAGDYIVFDNVGSYSIVLKPPFIMPNCPVVSIEGDKLKIVKRKETFDDVFLTYTSIDEKIIDAN